MSAPVPAPVQSQAPRVLAISPPADGPWTGQLDQLAAAGVDGLVLRLRDAPSLLDRILAAPLPAGMRVLVRPCRPGDLALAARHGLGLHLPSDMAPPAGQPPDRLVGQSCHNLGDLRRAAAEGRHYALLSPVFPPGSKPEDLRPTLGLPGLAAGCAAVDLPVLALGGVDHDNAGACIAAGAWGVAGIGAFFSGGSVSSGRQVDAASAARVVAAVRAALADPSAAPSG